MDQKHVLDQLDLRVACALQISGRSTWGELSAVLDVSERTVARRAQRLLDYGLVRIIGTIDTQRIGWGNPVLLRLRCEPGATLEVGRLLADRPDTRTVMLTSGSADCFVEVIPPTDDDLRELLLHTLPRLGVIGGRSTYTVLKFFTAAHNWHAHTLNPQEVEALRNPTLPEFGQGDRTDVLAEGDRPIVETLAAEGRIPVNVLARRLNLSPATASRRINGLIGRGVVRIRAELQPSLFGLSAEALVWMRVRPQNVEAAGQLLKQHPAVRTLIAATGEHQLFAHVVLGGRRELYEFITGTLGSVDGVQDVDVTDTLKALKRGGLVSP